MYRLLLSESVKLPQTQHEARPCRLSHRKAVGEIFEFEWYLYTELSHLRSGPLARQIFAFSLFSL